ncbi:hypothetical protein Tco_1312999 [Tanacetum coccineum]
MAAPVIPILSDSSEESVGSHVPRVILFDAIPAIILVTSLGFLQRFPYLPPELPLVSPFLCSDDSAADSESEPAEQRPERHESLTVCDVMVLREAIPFDRPYRTHPNGPRKLLTTRKRVGPFLARKLAWRSVSHRSPSDSLSDTSSVHSLGCDASGQTHSGSSTRVAQSRVIPRFISERSLDSSSLSAGPSRKICRSPTTLVPSSNPVSRSISPTHADLLPPHKRFRYSYSPEDSREEHMEIGIADAEAVADLVIGDGAHTKDGIVHYMLEVPLDRITEFETAQRQLEAGQLMASEERAGLTYRIKRLGLENLKVRALFCIERDRVDSLRHHMVLSYEEFCQIRRDHDDARRRLRRLESFVERRLGFRP